MSWLTAFDAHERWRRRLFRNAREEAEMLLIGRPVPTQEAYMMLGRLLGTLPPAAIFYRIFGEAMLDADSWFIFLPLCVLMNLACRLVGRWMGRVLGVWMDDIERRTWGGTIFLAALVGLLWGVLTGGAGGLVFFGFGAIFGVFCAVPVGVLAFAAFASLHRLLARGGMIEEAHLRPLAWGVAAVIAALILSPRIF
ncbi:MAG: hypothetical protein ACRD68_15635 [Pyrinomonadaceae bacterium]